VARQLKETNDFQVETVAGGLGELTVNLDGKKIIDTNRLWYPQPSKVVPKILERTNQ